MKTIAEDLARLRLESERELSRLHDFQRRYSERLGTLAAAIQRHQQRLEALAAAARHLEAVVDDPVLVAHQAACAAEKLSRMLENMEAELDREIPF